jgi:hypothetical protein
MTKTIDLSTLASRPPLKFPRLLAIAARMLFSLSITLMFIGYFWANYIYRTSEDLKDIEGAEILTAMMGNPGELLMSIGYYVLNIAFFAGILWLISLIVDKVDQLVWLNSSEEDRLHIYNQRQKKKQK